MRFLYFVFAVFVAAVIPLPVGADQTFSEFCSQIYAESSKCPQAACQLQCASGVSVPDCPQICIPKECKSISPQNCPPKFCSIVEDCSKKKICLPKIPADQVPECGALAYSAQDVECCKGLVKRCGFDYLDGKCNMEGKNTSYRFPICIPCGDGICANFENHCNCPEDCKKDIIPLD